MTINNLQFELSSLFSLKVFLLSIIFGQEPQLYAQEIIPRAETLINPDQLGVYFSYDTELGNDLYFYTPDEMEGQKIYRGFHSPLSPSIDEKRTYDNDVLDYATLQPLEKHYPTGSIYFRYFENDSLKMRFKSKDSTLTKTIALKHHHFVMSGPSLSVMHAALPLHETFKTQYTALHVGFPYWNSFEVSKIDYVLRVIGTDQIMMNQKKYDTFVLEVYPKDKKSGVYYKSWVTQKKPHIKLQSIYTSFKNKDEENRIFKIKKSFIANHIS